MRNLLLVATILVGVILLGFVTISGFLFFMGSMGGEEILTVSHDQEGEVEGDIINFEEMTEGQQDVFKRALRNGDETIPDDVNQEVWNDNNGVRYENETYRIYVSVP